MTYTEANQLRCLCHEMIIKLMEAGELTHLKLLDDHTKAAVEKLESGPTAKFVCCHCCKQFPMDERSSKSTQERAFCLTCASTE